MKKTDFKQLIDELIMLNDDAMFFLTGLQYIVTRQLNLY